MDTKKNYPSRVVNPMTKKKKEGKTFASIGFHQDDEPTNRLERRILKAIQRKRK